jgi:hypothetical protein
VGIRGRGLNEVSGEPHEGQIFNGFTLRNGRIPRDYRNRADALAAAGILIDAD